MDGGTIIHKTEYRERRNHLAFYHCSDPPDGFDTDRETFLGIYNGFDAPRSVAEGTSGNTLADGWSPVGSHRLDVVLEPGEIREMVFVLGYAENPPETKWESPGVVRKEPIHRLIVQSLTKGGIDKPDALDVLDNQPPQRSTLVLLKPGGHCDNMDKRGTTGMTPLS